MRFFKINRSRRNTGDNLFVRRCSAPRGGKPWLQFKQSPTNGDNSVTTFGNIVSWIRNDRRGRRHKSWRLAYDPTGSKASSNKLKSKSSFQETTTRCVGSATRMQHARLVQQEVTRLLLAARESLLNDLSELARLLPSWQQRALELAQNTHKEITKVRAPLALPGSRDSPDTYEICLFAVNGHRRGWHSPTLRTKYRPLAAFLGSVLR